MVPDGWKTLELGGLAKFMSGGTPSKSAESFWGGKHPWISGKDLKQHYLSSSIDLLTDEGFDSVNKAPAGSTLVLVRGMTLLKDFPVGFATRPLAFNQDIKALIPEKNIDGLFLSFLLAGNKEKIRQLVSTAGHGTGRLDTESLKDYPVMVPSPLEQKKIAKVLSTWDQAITATEQLLENSRQQKKALMQRLLTGKKRLPGFDSQWRKLPLTSCLLGSNLRNTGLTQGTDGIMSVNKSEGMIPMRAETIGKSIERYKVVKSGWFAYNPMRINVGSICRWTVENDCLVSPDYVVFSCDEEFLLSSYFDQFRQAEPWADYMRNAGNGSVRVRIYLNDLSLLKIPLPPLDEQEKIAAVLTTADQEIQNLQFKLACLMQEKKALMQQLLTGKRRVKVDEKEVA